MLTSIRTSMSDGECVDSRLCVLSVLVYLRVCVLFIIIIYRDRDVANAKSSCSLTAACGSTLASVC